MRLVSVIAIALAVVATASTALAQDPPATKSNTVAPKPKKVAKGKKKKQPAPTPVKDDAAPTADPPVAPATPPVTQPAPAPMQPDPAPPAPAAPPVSQTSTTSATMTSPADKDRVQKKEDESVAGVSVAPLLGLGTNGMGFGVGARVGYTLPMKLYVGGQFMYHFESGNDVVSASAFYPSAEVGYDLQPVKNLVVRPYGGFGMMFASVDTKIFGSETSVHAHSVVIYPGCTVTYAIPKSPVFVGGDARLVLAPQFEGATSIGLFATAGARF